MSGTPRTGVPSFDPLADAYDAGRPSYPDGLYDALPPLRGRRVLDVAAGTGIASRAMAGRGAGVVALDVGAAMLARLRARSPDLPAVRGDGQRLPFAAGTFDLVTYAQAFHWVDAGTAAAEAVRVLRPGGALAVWWNHAAADGEPWFDAQLDRLEAMNPRWRRHHLEVDAGGLLRGTGLFREVRTAEAAWSRAIDLDTYDTWLRSKSYVAALGERQQEFLDAERASLARAFPDGVVVEPFRTRLWVALA